MCSEQNVGGMYGNVLETNANEPKCVREIVTIFCPSHIRVGEGAQMIWGNAELALGHSPGNSGFPGNGQHMTWPAEYSVLGTLAALDEASLGPNVPIKSAT